MGAAEKFEQAAEVLGGELSGPDGSGRWQVQVKTGADRSQKVDLFATSQALAYHSESEVEVLHARSTIGPFTDVIDPHDLVGKGGAVEMAQVRSLDDEDKTLVVEGSLPAPIASPEALAAMIAETARRGDALENTYFGVDED